jgi:thiosulfate dehydrogenase [quinone] large subunit
VPVDPDGQERPALRPLGSRQSAPAVRPGLLGKASGSPVGSVAASALLPLRLFAGFTFLYAGIDKLALDRSFLDLSSRTSILVQLQGYAHASPLAPLLTALAIPNAWLMGVLIALAEIAVGLGILSGLAFRAAAWGGAALSLLFFLTASWNVHPYYFGQDLPYGLAFVTLALAGHGNRYVLGPWLDRRVFGAKPAGRQAPVPAPVSAERRYLLQAGLLGLSAIVLALVARPLRDLLLPASSANLSGTTASSGAVPPASAGPAAALSSGASSAGAPASTSNPLAIASTASVVQAGAVEFQVPTAIGNAAPGDPGIVVSLGGGTFAAFDAVCTHAGCTVGWNPAAGMLICPCHGATFDPRHNAQPVAGPTNIPLTELPISIQAGEITLRA